MTANRPLVTPPSTVTIDPKDSAAPVQPEKPPAPQSPTFAQPRPRSSVLGTIIGWLIIIGLAGAGWHYRDKLKPFYEPLMMTKKPAPPKRAPVIPVTTAAVRKRDVPLYLNGLGTVTAFKTVTLRSRVEGELIDVAFTEGQMVTEGDLLAEIDPRPSEVQLAQAESQLTRDEALLKSAKSTLSRYEGLFAKKSIAAQQVEDQAALVQQTAASIQADEAMINNAKLQLTYCKITAPITGRIGLRLVDKGNIVRANDPTGLAVITQLQPIALVFTIPQDDIVRVQQRVQSENALVVDAFDRDFKQKLASGKLVAIDNQVDATTGTVRLKAEFKNDDGMLFPNQFVNARLLVDTRRDAIVVPSAAVQRGPTSMYVYVVKAVENEKKEDEFTVELRDVVPGPAEGGETSIQSGVESGEIVVIDGLDKLQPGAKVKPRDKDAKADQGGGKEPPKKEKTEPVPGPTTRPSSDPGPVGPTASKGKEASGGDDPPADETKQKVSPSCDGSDGDTGSLPKAGATP